MLAFQYYSPQLQSDKFYVKKLLSLTDIFIKKEAMETSGKWFTFEN